MSIVSANIFLTRGLDGFISRKFFKWREIAKNYEITLCKGNILRSCKEETLILVENLDMQKGKKN